MKNFKIFIIMLILLKNILISQDLKKLIYMNEYIIADTTIYNDLYDIILPEYNLFNKDEYNAFFINYHIYTKKFNLSMIYAPISDNLDTTIYVGFFYIKDKIFIFDKPFKEFIDCLQKTNIKKEFIKLEKQNSKDDTLINEIIVDYPLWLMEYKNGKIYLIEKYI